MPEGGAPDVRWFILADGRGVVASAVVTGTPPEGELPVRCERSAPLPTEVHLVDPPQAVPSGEIELRAEAPSGPIVGFAAEFADEREDGARLWHQIASTTRKDGFTATWDASTIPAQEDGLVPVIAVVCLGGLGPTEAVDARALPQAAASGGGSTPPPRILQLDQQSRAAAVQAACRYPSKAQIVK